MWRLVGTMTLAAALAGCAPATRSAKAPAAVTPAMLEGDPCGVGEPPCQPGTAQNACFESFAPVIYGNSVRVTSRLAGDAQSCPSGGYCQCVTATVGTGQAGACRLCRRVEYRRIESGPSSWWAEVFDFKQPVNAVTEVGYRTGK
jgi:hypothetical protein